VGKYLADFALFGILACTLTAQADFVPDEFNSSTLGSQWTWHDSDPTGSTYNLSGTHFEIDAIEGADMFFTIDKYAYLEQDAPSGTNWEIVTKVEGFDPTETGKQNNWNKCGIKVWQDVDHWFGVWVMGNDGAPTWDRRVEGAYDSWDSSRGGSHLWEYAGDQVYTGVTQDPIWLKIQKTEHGYFGLYSLDGTNWIQVNRLIRNSQNPDGTGYFTSEKIHLLQSSPGNNGTNDVGAFDFIRTGPVPVPAAPAGTDDEFTGTALNSNVWGKHEGILASDISVSDGKLKIIPGNFNDQWGGVDKAGRVFQDAPTSGSWRFTVKVGPNLLFDYQDWAGYGIMLWQDQNDYVLISNVRNPQGAHVLQTAYQRDDAYLWNANPVQFVGNPVPEYLRITKTGTRYTASHSLDNITYTNIPDNGYDYPAELKNPQVQLFGKKTNAQGGPQLVVEFDWVRFESLDSDVEDWQLY